MTNPPLSPDSPLGATPIALRNTVLGALRFGAPAICVTGGPGSGKTALCRELGATTDDRLFSAVLYDATLDPDGVLAQLVDDFGLGTGTGKPGQSSGRSREALSAALVRFLNSLKPLNAHALIVIDNAEQVGIDVFNTLVAVARDVRGDDALLRLVLVGRPALEAKVLEPPLSQFPGVGEVWTRLSLSADDSLVPALRPDSPWLPAIESEPQAAVVSPMRRLLWLVGALLLVAAAAAAAYFWMVPSTTAPPPPTTGTLTTPSQVPNPAPAASGSPAAPNAAPSGARDGGAAAAPASASPQAATPSGAPSAAGPYRITVASFRTIGRAEEIASSLKAQRVAVTTRSDPAGAWHQVVAGPYASIDTAREAQRALERAGFPDTHISLVSQSATSAR